MFTQLFGHFLLNKKIITPEQLRTALEAKANTKVKIGALAIDAGYMTGEEVEFVHEMQKTMDKRIGDIAIEMGFLRPSQVEELLAKQKTANIILGQSLIDLGFMTNKQFEDALREYKSGASFADEYAADEKIAEQFIGIFRLDEYDDKRFYADYLMLLIKNLIRFVGDDFALAGCQKNEKVHLEHVCSQKIIGSVAANTAIGGDKEAFLGLATRYAGEEVTEVDELAEACAGEFLNMQNGLFSVNISNARNTDLNLTPQICEHNKDIELTDSGLCVELTFSFGTIEMAVIKT